MSENALHGHADDGTDRIAPAAMEAARVRDRLLGVGDDLPPAANGRPESEEDAEHARAVRHTGLDGVAAADRAGGHAAGRAPYVPTDAPAPARTATGVPEREPTEIELG